MRGIQILPKTATVTDLRYRWAKISKELDKNQEPFLILEHSTPKAVIISVNLAKEFLRHQKLGLQTEDPLVDWRRKYTKKFSNWNATKTLRAMRDLRWNLCYRGQKGFIEKLNRLGLLSC